MDDKLYGYIDGSELKTSTRFQYELKKNKFNHPSILGLYKKKIRRMSIEIRYRIVFVTSSTYIVQNTIVE